MKKNLFGMFLVSVFFLVGAAITNAAEYNYNFITTDNGMQGLWATDYFKSKVTITNSGTENCYRVVRQDTGRFVSLPDAKSPGGTGGRLIGNGTEGTIAGGITQVVCGTLVSSPSTDTAFEDLRTYTNTTGFYAGRYFHRFFSSITSESWESWGWTFSTCNNGTWTDNDATEADYAVHAPSALMGDINGTYLSCKPTDKDQCKKDGWKSFNNPSFKNQGQCVSFVEKSKNDDKKCTKGWNVTGDWSFDVVSTKFPGTYPKTMTINQDTAGNITGSGKNAPSGNTWAVAGTVVGTTVNFTLTYDAPMAGYVATFIGTINTTDGTMLGTWSDVTYGDSGPWHTTAGKAILGKCENKDRGNEDRHENESEHENKNEHGKKNGR